LRLTDGSFRIKPNLRGDIGPGGRLESRREIG
jgi:hypothetical protein